MGETAVQISKRLGRSPMRLAAVGQGTGDGWWNSALDEQTKIRRLQQGFDLGLTFIDTAEAYGAGISEELVGRAIAGRRHEVVVATKFSPEHHARADVLRAAETSLRRLGSDRIDVYQMHWPNPAVPIEETMGALRVLLERGLIRSVGLCNVSVRQLREAQAALGAHRLVSVQTEYNLFERTAEADGLLDSCAEQGLTVLAYSPLDQGRLAAMSPSQREELEAIAARSQKTVAQVILRWLIAHPAVVAISRATQERHLVENAGAMAFDLSEDELHRIREVFPFTIVHIPTDCIRVAAQGEWGRTADQTLEEALANAHGNSPSPAELAEAIRAGDFLKPVRVVPATDSRDAYDLIGGRVRYWAWVIAYGGTRPIPALIRDS